MGKIDLRKFASDPLAFFSALTIPSAHGALPFSEVMADFQRERFTQIAPVLLAIATGEKPATGRYWWEATKGASKDSDLACCLLWLLAFTKRPLTCQVGAADADQADELRKAAKDILRLNGWLAARVEVQSWKVLCKATESECEIIAADVAGSHGARPDVLLLNELSHIQKREFAENLMDNAAKVPHGLAVVATNSGFIGTWQERWCKIAEASDRWLTNCYSRPAPWLDDAEIEEAQRRNSNSRFMRLFNGIWTTQAGDALDADDIAAAVNPDARPILSASKHRDVFYVAGLDLGIKQDHSALVVLRGDRRTLQLRLACARNWAPNPSTKKVNLMAVEHAVLTAHKTYKLRTVGYDPHQAALMAQRLELQKVPMQEMTFTGANLNLMASTVLDVFRSRRIELYDHKQLVDDLSRLTIEEKSYGYRLSAIRNESGHADLATALAIALPLAVEKAGKVPLRIGALFDEDAGMTPLQRELKRMEAKAAAYEAEMRFLSQPYDHQEPFRNLMRRIGRL